MQFYRVSLYQNAVNVKSFEFFIDKVPSAVYIDCINTNSTAIQKGQHMILIDYKDRRPLYEQIVDRFQEMILKGILSTDAQLPSVRSLAMDLSINPNTIQRAYGELERLGYIYSIKGKGSFAADIHNLLPQQEAALFHELDELVEKAVGIGITYERLIFHIQARREKKND